MSGVEECDNCKFYRDVAGLSRKACMRFPPQVYTNAIGDPASRQPASNRFDWCGEWQPKVTDK